MTDCMLSEERLEALMERIVDDFDEFEPFCMRETLKHTVRRFFAPPPGSVRVEVVVSAKVFDDGKYAVVERAADSKTPLAQAIKDVEQLMRIGDATHLSVLSGYVLPVPPTPSVEVIQ